VKASLFSATLNANIKDKEVKLDNAKMDNRNENTLRSTFPVADKSATSIRL
jgi:hypothetical protein